MNPEGMETSSSGENARSWRDEAVGAGRFRIVGASGVAINLGALVTLSAIGVTTADLHRELLQCTRVIT